MLMLNYWQLNYNTWVMSPCPVQEHSLKWLFQKRYFQRGWEEWYCCLCCCVSTGPHWVISFGSNSSRRTEVNPLILSETIATSIANTRKCCCYLNPCKNSISMYKSETYFRIYNNIALKVIETERTSSSQNPKRKNMSLR